MEHSVNLKFSNKKLVRIGWDEDESSWLYCSIDLIDAVIKTSNPRIYWYTVKRRHPEVAEHCRQIKMKASDSKTYMTDCLTLKGIDSLLDALPSKKRPVLKDWLNGGKASANDRAKKKACSIFESGIVDENEFGSVKALRQIHSYLFDGIYDFAGKVTDKTVSRGWFMFSYSMPVSELLKDIDKMPQGNISQILSKFVRAEGLNPFEKGSGPVLRIWLDQMLIKALKKRIAWEKVDKKQYFEAIKLSSFSPSQLINVLSGALIDHFGDSESPSNSINSSFEFEDPENE